MSDFTLALILYFLGVLGVFMFAASTRMPTLPAIVLALLWPILRAVFIDYLAAVTEALMSDEYSGENFDRDDDLDRDGDREKDEIESALQECGQIPQGGCTLAGTEYCDFDCPFRDVDLSETGKPPADASRFLRRDGGKDVFHFVCAGCDEEGELSIDLDHRGTIGCPAGCGATYVKTGEPPKLTCVVWPAEEE